MTYKEVSVSTVTAWVLLISFMTGLSEGGVKERVVRGQSGCKVILHSSACVDGFGGGMILGVVFIIRNWVDQVAVEGSPLSASQNFLCCFTRP